MRQAWHLHAAVKRGLSQCMPRLPPRKTLAAASDAASGKQRSGIMGPAGRKSRAKSDPANAATDDTSPTPKRRRTTTTESKASKASKAKTTSKAGPGRAEELKALRRGHKVVAGVDEAGRGPLAGPVVAGACIVPEHVDLTSLGVTDSKQMSEEQREVAYEALMAHPDVVCATAFVDHEEIDRINILQAAMLAMSKAVEGLKAAGASEEPTCVLVDGPRAPQQFSERGIESVPIVKGDSRELCIAAASVLAKVERDRAMLDLHKQYPQYGFDQHKGYPVPAHKEAVARLGPCPVHRKSFQPIKGMLGWEREPAMGSKTTGKSNKPASKRGKKAK
ncbi:unnamed protein product [Pedinophyceae sp. YPF-701]|nr:unnamed protein product [Pedinophyceae sp. YPF-701]